MYCEQYIKKLALFSCWRGREKEKVDVVAQASAGEPGVEVDRKCSLAGIPVLWSLPSPRTRLGTRSRWTLLSPSARRVQEARLFIRENDDGVRMHRKAQEAGFFREEDIDGDGVGLHREVNAAFTKNALFKKKQVSPEENGDEVRLLFC